MRGRFELKKKKPELKKNANFLVKYLEGLIWAIILIHQNLKLKCEVTSKIRVRNSLLCKQNFSFVIVYIYVVLELVSIKCFFFVDSIIQ